MRQGAFFSYKHTIYACYLGDMIQAAVINLTPILFIPLREQFGLSYQQLGTLIFVNFITQVICDFAFGPLVDRYGFRPFITAAQAVAAGGFILFALSPLLLRDPYPGFLIATVIFSGAGGLQELLLSPIVSTLPVEGDANDKAKAMTVLHSFYAWGQVAVVLVTTLLLSLLGGGSWPWILLGWAALPLVNLFLFMKVPLGRPVPEGGRRTDLGTLFKSRFFVVALTALVMGAAAEVCMAQWTSAFLERAMGLPKVVGDTVGVCLFAAMLGLGRLLHGIFGDRMNLEKVMLLGSFTAFLCYCVVGLTGVPVLSLLACALCGLAVSLLWPGILVLADRHFPAAGAMMFAILAGTGDVGCSVAPWLMGIVTEQAPKIPALAGLGGLSAEELGLRAGMFFAALFPLIGFFCLRWMGRQPRETAPKR